MIGGQQQMADDDRNLDDDRGNQITQVRLPTDRIPIEGEEGAKAAKGEGYNHAESKREARSDQTQAIVGGLHREFIEAAASPPRHLLEQPLGAKAKRHQDGEFEKGHDPPVPIVDLAEAGGGSLELAGQIRDGTDECHDLLVDRAGTRI
jgi:hypothetical protein